MNSEMDEKNNVMMPDNNSMSRCPDDLTDPHIGSLEEKFSKMSHEDDNIPVQTSVPVEEDTKENGLNSALLGLPSSSHCNTQDINTSSTNDTPKFRKENTLEIRFSTILFTGLQNSGKTSLCELLMDTTASTSPHILCIKKGTSPKDTKVDTKKLDELIDKLTQYKEIPHQRNPLNHQEAWDLLLLLDKNVPTTAVCLLQPLVVTFVTYRVLGENFRLKNTSSFFEFEKEYSTLVKELMASNPKKQSSLELELTDEEVDCKNIVFVGIYKGKGLQESNAKEIRIVNECLSILKKNINCCFENLPVLLIDKDDKQYLHLVNLANHEDEDFGQIQSKLKGFITDNSSHKLPLSWVLLYLMIQKLSIENKKSVFKFSEVMNLFPTELESSELKDALKFFHHVGALFYFDTVEDIGNNVYTNLGWLFSKLNNLDSLYNYLTENLTTTRYDRDAKKVWKREGKLIFRLLKKIKDNDSEKRALINLLEHLKLIAPLGKNEYFFPSVLDSYDSDNRTEVFKHYGKLQCSPLLITFSSGLLYRNVFCFLAAHIMKNTDWSKPKYVEDEEHQYTFKDLIMFYVDKYHYVCIIDKIFFLEIQIYCESGDNCSSYPHHKVYKVISQSLEYVCKENLKLPESYKLLYGFSCYCNNECRQNVHLMIIKNLEDNTQAYCSKKDKPQSLTEDHTVWFSESSTLVQATDDSDCTTSSIDGSSKFTTTSQEVTKQHSGGTDSLAVGNIVHRSSSQLNSKPTRRNILNFVVPLVTPRWYELGVMLLNEDQESHLDTIRNNKTSDNEECCKDMFWYWLTTNLNATWQQLIDALKTPGVNLPAVAAQLLEKDFTGEYSKQDAYSAPVNQPDSCSSVDEHGNPLHSVAIGEGIAKERFKMTS